MSAMRVLQAAGAELDNCSHDGWTPLALAARYGTGSTGCGSGPYNTHTLPGAIPYAPHTVPGS